MKTLVPQGVSRSVLSLATCGYLPCSGQKCQKFARKHPQGYARNFQGAIHRTDHSQSLPSPPQIPTHTASRVSVGGEHCSYVGRIFRLTEGSLSDGMIFSDPLPDCAHQAGGADALVAG